MPSFFAAAFALAGLAAAAGPLAIHLIHRRRVRVVEWAAMELLREALGERRRRLRLRDATLLALRTACVLLFGLAMARPYWSRASGNVEIGGVEREGPVHAILLIDNSLSMAYEQLGGTLLNAAKARAREFLDSLPSGSRASVLPMCGSDDDIVWEPYRNMADAVRYLEAIEIVDQTVNVTAACDLAAMARGAASDVAQKRVVLIGDQQAINWPIETGAELGQRLGEVQMVQVAAETPGNAWIAAFEWQDGLADAETNGCFLVTVGYEGPQPRPDVLVTLSVAGTVVANRVIDLEPGQANEQSFSHRFTDANERGSAESGQPSFVMAAVKLSPDRLPADDERVLVVPVVTAAPVLFVDSVGADEDRAANRYGETYRLQCLLAPAAARGERSQELVKIQRAKIDELTSELLAASRLVVVAGVEQPHGAVPLLRRYVEEGGPLLIAAGGRFDPLAWQATAWLDGDGILPAPLRGDMIGRENGPAGAGMEPFWLDTATLNHDYFRLEEVGPDELADLFRAPLFFQTVAVDESGAGFQRWVASLPLRSRPRTLARFGNHMPFMIERDVGRGQVLFVASGIGPESNTLSETNAVVLYDRIARSMLSRGLPRRNLDPCASYSMAVEGAARLDRYSLTRPNGMHDELAVEALGDGSHGVKVHGLWQRGAYRISAKADESAPERSRAGGELPDDELHISLAVNGSQRESQLRCLTPAELNARLAAADSRLLTGHEPISLAGPRVRAEGAWMWLMAGVLGLLMAELLWLAWPSRLRERTT